MAKRGHPRTTIPVLLQKELVGVLYQDEEARILTFKEEPFQPAGKNRGVIQDPVGSVTCPAKRITPVLLSCIRKRNG